MTSVSAAMVAGEALPSRARSARFYHPELDTLRFFAFFAVFVHHALPHEESGFAALGAGAETAAWLTSVSLAGRFGVDLFFVLSSYLITELLLREYGARGSLDVKSFYIRRALRIWPLYYFFLALTLLVVPRLVASESFPWPHPVWYALLAGNWSVALFGYPESVAAPLWSVSIEEQFYLAWPLVIGWLGPGRLRRVAIVMLLVATATRLALAAIGAQDRAYWTVTPARLDPIAIGALLAFVLQGRTPVLGGLARWMLLAAGPLVWILAVRFNPGGWGNVVVYPAVALTSAGMVAAMLREHAGSVAGSRALVYLGRVSYGLYVYHVLSLELAERIVPPYGGISALLVRGIVALAITMSFAAASYHLLEMPFLRLKARFTHVESRL